MAEGILIAVIVVIVDVVESVAVPALVAGSACGGVQSVAAPMPVACGSALGRAPPLQRLGTNRQIARQWLW